VSRDGGEGEGHAPSRARESAEQSLEAIESAPRNLEEGGPFADELTREKSEEGEVYRVYNDLVDRTNALKEKAERLIIDVRALVRADPGPRIAGVSSTAHPQVSCRAAPVLRAIPTPGRDSTIPAPRNCGGASPISLTEIFV
jgi:hypothetical protein